MADSLDLARARTAARPLVVTGQITDKRRKRVGVLDVNGPRVRVVCDVWLDDARALADELQAPLGRWDTMHGTRWKYAWHGGDVWDARGLRAHVRQRGIVELRRTLGGFMDLPVTRVRAALSQGWLVRTVAVVDVDAREHVVARKRELSVVIDPVYDGIDLMFDGAWCSQMAQSLATALGVPCDVDEDLR